MSSIYIHIPYCKQKCHYCNFYSTVSQKSRPELIKAIIEEIALKKSYLPSKNIDSIYFGGGTPSLLKESEFAAIFNEINKYFSVNSDCEITVEANPDDVSRGMLNVIGSLGVNRLSIGIQSFNDELLQRLNRVHSAYEAKQSVLLAREFGIDNLNVDLIYGIPGLSMDLWKEELEIFKSFDIAHLSSYFLTIEPKTALAHLVKNKKYPPINEEEGMAHFDYLMLFMQENGYEHYEISNFSLPGKESRHNSNYWKNRPYLGIGPSAHSYNLISRQWNSSSIKNYIEEISSKIGYADLEELSLEDRYNEFVMLGLRTSWGVNLKKMELIFGKKYIEYFLKKVEEKNLRSFLLLENDTVKLSSEGKKLADGIASDLFWM